MYFILICVLLVVLYLYGKRNHNHWKVKGVKFEEPIIFFGSTLNNKLKNVCFSERFINMYREYPDDKYIGFFEGNRPALLIRDPDIIQHIFINIFFNFHHRGANAHKEITEPLMKNIFNADGDLWKIVRQKITPAFTSAKLKAMFPLIVEQAEKLIENADGFIKTDAEIDSRELMARFTTDFIGACGFGINMNSQNDGNSEFRKLGKRIFTFTNRDMIVSILKRTAPNIFKHLHLVSPEVEESTMKLLKYVMAQRNYEPTGRNDFIDMMLELKQKGKISGESIEKRKSDGTTETVEIEVDDELIVAQAFVFFAAGFETSSSSSSYLLHLLAHHPDKQERCQEEIDEVMARYDNKLCYDAVKEMKYLEMAFKEALRIYTPVGWLQRRCVAACKLPGTDFIIDEGTDIVISAQGLHTDDKYFENPDEFEPERFDPDSNKSIKNNAYMPFGAGPRACIGERLGIMQSLAGLAAVLSKFSVSPSKSTVYKPAYDPSSYQISTIVGGLPLSFSRRHWI
ncbi:cytochrome P450 6B6-like [Aricia agestis]|uniref:cytochrome P450 6B6-like n=1 Tax=Aricia agestis TaxID=91739 RepID=UPI001C20C1C1|nr:cytochrome P450 6B6-like [Aricia agestis]